MKNFTKLLLVATVGIGLTIFNSTSFSATNCKGDLNNDGKITAVDLSLMKQLTVGFTPAGVNKSNADMNGDGKISAVDLSQLKQAIVDNKICRTTKTTQTTQTTTSFKQQSGYATKKYNVYINSTLSRRNTSEYIVAGDYVTVTQRYGSAYQVEYTNRTGTKIRRYVPVSGFTLSKTKSLIEEQRVANASGSSRKGDLNNDGKITAVDISMMRQLIVGPAPAGVNKSNADMNGDGKISAVDLSLLRQAVVSSNQSQTWTGIAKRKTYVFQNPELTKGYSYEWIDPGDKVTVFKKQGDAYYVRYPTSSGKTKDRWVSKDVFKQDSSTRVSYAQKKILLDESSDKCVDSFSSVEGRKKVCAWYPHKGYKKNGNTDTGKYSCATFVHNFYWEMYKIKVANLFNSNNPRPSGAVYAVKDGTVKAGDLIAFKDSTHWAIAKGIDSSGKIVVIEQNYGGSNGAPSVTINRRVSRSKVSGIFRK